MRIEKPTIPSLLMLGSFTLATTFAVLAYAFEAQFALGSLVALHVVQIPLAAVFKLSYVLRLSAQTHQGIT